MPIQNWRRTDDGAAQARLNFPYKHAHSRMPLMLKRVHCASMRTAMAAMGKHGVPCAGIKARQRHDKGGRATGAADNAGGNAHPAAPNMAVNGGIGIAARGESQHQTRTLPPSCCVPGGLDLQGRAGHGHEAAWNGRLFSAAGGRGLHRVRAKTAERAQQQRGEKKGVPAKGEGGEGKAHHRNVVLLGEEAAREWENEPGQAQACGGQALLL